VSDQEQPPNGSTLAWRVLQLEAQQARDRGETNERFKDLNSKLNLLILAIVAASLTVGGSAIIFALTVRYGTSP
jgi:hypothetical protein